MAGPSEIYTPDLLAGRVALVTGGGTNLGREAARELLAAGARVVIAGRRAEVLQEACADLGPGATHVAGDIREAAEQERIVAEARARHGRLDVLVNNAGGQYFVPAEAITDKGWAAVQRLNVGGTLGMCEAAARHGFGPDGGAIVNVTVSPHGGMPAMAHTGAARAAVEALGRELAAAWAGRGIAVTSLAIGRFDTASLRKYPAVLTRSIARTVPVQRLGTMQGVRLGRRPAGLAAGPQLLRRHAHARRRRRQLARRLAHRGSVRGRRRPDRGAPRLRAEPRAHLGGQRRETGRRAHHHGELLDPAVRARPDEVEPLQVAVADARGEDQRVCAVARQLVGVAEVLEDVVDRSQQRGDALGSLVGLVHRGGAEDDVVGEQRRRGIDVARLDGGAERGTGHPRTLPAPA
jgi:citronellol/citronellal dehydrogenase